jgi:hypothetical protein
VKRALAILLFCIYTFGATDACQLLKLPLLVSHYLKHKKENPHTTLAAFFKMHYIDPQPMDEDYAQDMRLPFKTMPDAFFRHTPTVVSYQPFVKLNSIQVINDQPPVFNEDAYSTLLINKIFQPPRSLIFAIYC